MNYEKSITRFISACFFIYGACKHRKSQQAIQKNDVPEFRVPSALKLPSCELVVFIVIRTRKYMVTEGRNFKPFLEENNVIACYLFTKKTLT